jgi:molecular chaperone GrpE
LPGEDDDTNMVDKRSASKMDGESEANEEQRSEGTKDPLAEALENAETYRGNWQRAAADLANYKRRVEQDRAENARLANMTLVVNLLPIFDDLDRAIATMDASIAGLNWVQGVVAIHRKLEQLLDAMNVKEIAADGEAFDPAKHEAVGKQAGEEDRVIHVLQKGYTLADRVIRPSMVMVGDGTVPDSERDAK